MSPTLEINLFGEMQIHISGSVLPVTPSVRARMSLAYLVTYQRPHTYLIGEADTIYFNEKAVWRRWMKNVRSGESAYLQSTRELVAFIKKWAGELGSIGESLNTRK